jgi:Uma2 family endonuclease
MIDANVFPDDARVELLGGLLVAMTTNDAHDFIVNRLANLLRLLLPDGWCLREEKSVQLGRYWRPQPDISVLRGQDDAFARRSPQPADIGLLVEVADSSYPKDSGRKLRRYAAVGVPVYWIVNVGQAQVEVHHEPRGQMRRAYYHKVEIYDLLAQVPVVVDGQEQGRIPVKDMLP